MFVVCFQYKMEERTCERWGGLQANTNRTHSQYNNARHLGGAQHNIHIGINEEEHDQRPIHISCRLWGHAHIFIHCINNVPFCFLLPRPQAIEGCVASLRQGHDLHIHSRWLLPVVNVASSSRRGLVFGYEVDCLVGCSYRNRLSTSISRKVQVP